MPEADRRQPTPLHGPLARLQGAREELAKAWLVRLIERASLEEIKTLPTERIAAELPELISDVLAVAADGERGDRPQPDPGAHERAAHLAELRQAGMVSASALTLDVAAIGHVILDALRADASELGAERTAELALAIGDAVAAMQATALEALAGRRSRELESLSTNDSLTGLSNMAQLQQQLGHALELHRRYGQRFALLALDVDGLRRVNDSSGRAAGDRLLVAVALAVRRTIRTVDTPARIGDDELGILAPNQDAAAARALGERLAEAIGAETAGPQGSGVRVAVGVVACPEHGDDATTLLGAADQAMYRAKAGGEAVAVGDPSEPEIKVQRTST